MPPVDLPGELKVVATAALEKIADHDGLIKISVQEQRGLKKLLEQQNKELQALKEREKQAKADENKLKEELKAAKQRRAQATQDKKQAVKRRLEGEFEKVANQEEKGEGPTPEHPPKKHRAKAKSVKPAEQPMSPSQIRAMISPKAKGLAGRSPELKKDPRKENAIVGLKELHEAGISGLTLPADDFDKKKFDCT